MFNICITFIAPIISQNLTLVWFIFTWIIAVIVIHMVFAIYADKCVMVEFSKLKDPIIGCKFNGFKLVELNNKNVITLKNIDTTDIGNTCTGDNVSLKINDIRRIQYSYMLNFYFHIYVYFTYLIAFIFLVFMSFFMCRYIISAVAYYFNIHNSILRPDFIVMLNTIFAWTALLGSVTFTIVSLRFLYQIFVMSTLNEISLRYYVFSIVSFKIILFCYIKSFGTNVFTKHFDKTKYLTIDNWSLNSSYKIESIVNFNNTPFLYVLFFVGTGLYVRSIFAVFSYKQHYAINRFIIGRVTYVWFLLVNIVFDIMMFVMLLIPELPLVIINVGYDSVELLQRFSGTNVFYWPGSMSKIVLSGEYILISMLVFNAFVNTTFILLITSLSRQKVACNTMYTMRSWLTMKFWFLVFKFSLSIILVYLLCILIVLLYSNNVVLNDLVSLNFDSILLEYAAAVQACVIATFIFYTAIVAVYFSCALLRYIKSKVISRFL